MSELLKALIGFLIGFMVGWYVCTSPVEKTSEWDDFKRSEYFVYDGSFVDRLRKGQTDYE